VNYLRQHLLLDKAFVYPLPVEKPDMGEYVYDMNAGYWLLDKNNPLILNKSFIKPRSKKEDVETGEDQKGE
jgi:hypothetical protein